MIPTTYHPHQPNPSNPKSPVPRPEAMKNLRSGAIRGLRRGEVLKLRNDVFVGQAVETGGWVPVFLGELLVGKGQNM